MRTPLALAASLTVAGALCLTPSLALADETDPDSGIETDYGRMMLVLDSSGSMKEAAAGGQTRIEAARTALTEVINTLPDDADVGLQVFGATVFSRNDAGACTDTQVVVAPGTDNRAELLAAVGDYAPYGETPIPVALEEAAKALGGEGKRSIVLVSDGESTCGNPCEVAAGIANSGVDIQIDVVGLSVSGEAKKQLQCVADSGNGTYYDADDAEDLTESLQRISERAVQPFLAQGTPVEGTTSQADAPEIGPGVWLDDLPATDEALHYLIPRSIAGSTLWAGVVAQPNQAQQQVRLTFRTEDGHDCGSDRGHNSVSGKQRAALLAASTPSKDSDRCADQDVLVLSVAKTQFSKGDPEVAMQLLIHEEPPVVTTDGLPEGVRGNTIWEKVDLGDEISDVTPGNTLNDAPLLEQGRHRTPGIVPGEAQVYKVRVEWGESLQVRAVLPVNAAASGHFGRYGPVVRIGIISPTGGSIIEALKVRDEYDELLQGHAYPPTRVDRGDAYLHAKTQPIRWLNREASGEQMSMPGDYYIVVNQGSHESSVITPLELEVSMVGTPGEGAPQYADGAAIAGPDTGSAEDPSSAAGTATDAADDPADGSGDTLTLVAGASAVAAGLLAIGIGVAMLLRRRSRAGTVT
ncbi:VWA domain-containing protein [Nocardioides sp. AE5]|uniref:vWA domain-containing protein n=1 Tax=Nocardioides sp. AE5 TaxID=2962573 RepID=UPI00288264BE|nr:VWA domain-containing protein [Nocardioides sp. AE5]MDT0201671.1 VWA domain-containing protein [Nocardioides sp. AE5]